AVLFHVPASSAIHSLSLHDALPIFEAVYHLVHMIYLDRVVEDVELEVATIYAQRLGFQPSVVSELFTAIVTSDAQNARERDVREEVIEFLKLHKDEI